MQFRIILFLSILFPILSYAQDKAPIVKITGKVIEESSGLPLEFATVSLFLTSDNSLIGGGLTGIDGTFSIDAGQNPMYVLVEFLSFSTKRIDNIAPKSGQREIALGNIIPTIKWIANLR